MQHDPVIRVAGLFHRYPNGVEALAGVDLEIKRGEFTAIVGQNGSGKTTLAKHFNGLLNPTKGSVYVMGEDTRNSKVSVLSRKVGYVFQNPDDMLFSSSVEEEIAFAPKMMGFPEELIQQRVEETLEALELESLRSQHPFALSLGDRQRVAVACALSLDPEVFVFDEPTTGQDYVGSKSIMAILDKLHTEGKTILTITHDMQLVAEHVQRVVVMNQGRIVLDEAPQAAFTQVDLLEKLWLRPPSVTLLEQRLGWDGPSFLNVADFSEAFAARWNQAHPVKKESSEG